MPVLVPCLRLLGLHPCSSTAFARHLRPHAAAWQAKRTWLSGREMLSSRPLLPSLEPGNATLNAHRRSAIAGHLAAISCDPHWLAPLHPEHDVKEAHGVPVSEGSSSPSTTELNAGGGCHGGPGDKSSGKSLDDTDA